MTQEQLITKIREVGIVLKRFSIVILRAILRLLLALLLLFAKALRVIYRLIRAAYRELKSIDYSKINFRWINLRRVHFRSANLKHLKFPINRRSITVVLVAVISVILICALFITENPDIPKIIQQKKAISRSITNEMSDLAETKKFDRDIELFMRRWDLKGASFALMRNDSLIYAKGYGFANLESEERCEVNHIFRMASASKLITGAAIMKLIEMGKLKLTSKVYGEEGILNDPKFLNLKDRNMKLITVEHLLRHTGGYSTPILDPAFANYSVSRALNIEMPITLDDMVVYSTMHRLKYRPGGSYSYSNMGYMVLTKIIEEVSGEGYEKFVRDNLLLPAGCYDISIGQNFIKDRASNEVHYYEVKEADKVYAYDGSGELVKKSDGGNNVTLLSGAGGWIASPVELLRFVSTINGCPTNKDVLSKESIRTMTHDSKRDKPIGWATIRGTEWTRSGSMAGTSTLIKKQRDGYTWVFITNSSSWNGYRLSNQISYNVTRAISKVKRWPHRNLFSKDEVNRLAKELENKTE